MSACPITVQAGRDSGTGTRYLARAADLVACFG
jgi:hypothetical protein